MDVNLYVSRVEEAVDNPVELERIRGEVAQDAGLADDDKRVIDGRIGTYLADADRAEFGSDHTPDTAPDEAA